MAIDHGHDPHDHGHYHPPAGTAPIERYSDPAQESLNQALRSGFNVLRIILVLLVIAYFASGIFQVAPGQQGLIVRFGELRMNQDPNGGGTPIFGQGWHAALPDPFDEKVLLTGQSLELAIPTFMFEPFEKERDKPVEEMTVPERDQLRPGFDGAMLTGDRNLAHGMWKITFRIVRADQFVHNVGEHPAQFEPLLRRLTEDSVIRSVASRTIEQVTREERESVKDSVKLRLQARLDALKTGVQIENIVMFAVEPGKVRRAFIEVTQAQNDREKSIKDAENDRLQRLNQAGGPKYEKLLKAIEEYGAAQTAHADEARLVELRAAIDQQLDQAEGTVAVRLREAQNRANEQRESVRREYDRFEQYVAAYRRDPQVTAIRLWVEMRDTILSSKFNEIFYVPKAGVIEILVNRDPLRQIEADRDRYYNPNKPPPGPQNTNTTVETRRR